MSERPTFSPFWHRVRTMKPRLRPHVQITRQRYRGRRWHVVHDPASNQFYRLNPIAHEFVGMLDGSHDVETAWKAALQKFGDSAPTQNEVISLISQLYSANLLTADVPPETEQLLKRGKDRLKRKIQQQLIGIMYFKIPVFNPDRMLTALEPVFRPILNRWGFLAWCLVLFAALWQVVIPRWGDLTAGFDALAGGRNPGAWAWLAAVWVVTKVIHEMGHGLLCKRFGGQVPEFGFMLLVLFPSPYVDASACWAFPSKWQRVAVGAGGMLFELFIASIAAFVWAQTDDATIRQIAYSAMLTASVSTVLFNANPLMRFDGYYILADLVEVPNLAQRSNQILKHLIQKYVFRIERPSALMPSQLPGERVILVVYGLLSMAYRIFLFVSITLYVMGKLFAIGLVLAVWTSAAWFIMPIGSFVHWLSSNSSLAEHRLRTVVISLLLIAAGLIGIGVIPWPDHRRSYGVLQSLNRSGIYVGTDGFIVEAHHRPGDEVKAGEAIVTLQSPELVQQRAKLLAMIAETRVDERQAYKEGKPSAAQLADDRLRVYSDNLEEIDRRISELVVRAPHDGVIVSNDPTRLVGAFAKRGQAICEVVDTSKIRVAAIVEQPDADWLFDPQHTPVVKIKRFAMTDSVIPATRIEPVPAGREELISAALGYSGGGAVETNPEDRSGQSGRRPTFTVLITPDIPTGDHVQWLSPGERVKIRYTLPSKPLLVQWLDRLSKTIQGRVDV
ncbi:MAG: PqqD family peptide modification chaperone [Phycisphaeraceae bacterium]|nr:PqqD family peptide modification chaperone [Phycisphaeraceae bacterium]